MFVRYKTFGSRNKQGSGSSTHESSSPFASDAVLGITILRPAQWAKYPSTLCEWYNPPATVVSASIEIRNGKEKKQVPWPTAWHGARIVSPPALNCPPDRYRYLAASLTI